MELGKRYYVKQSAILPITEEMTKQSLVLIVTGYELVEIVLMGEETTHGEVIREKIYLYDSSK